MQRYGNLAEIPKEKRLLYSLEAFNGRISAGRRDRRGFRAGLIGARQYPEYDGLHTRHRGHARCTDTGMIRQSESPLALILP